MNEEQAKQGSSADAQKPADEPAIAKNPVKISKKHPISRAAANLVADLVASTSGVSVTYEGIG